MSATTQVPVYQESGFRRWAQRWNGDGSRAPGREVIVDGAGRRLVIFFPYDENVVAALRTMPVRRFIRTGVEVAGVWLDGPCWTVPLADLPRLGEVVVRPFGFTTVTRRGETVVEEEATPAVAVPIGIFTVSFEGGEYRTIRVRDRGFRDGDGSRIVSYLSGPNNERSYTGFAHVDRAGHLHVWRQATGRIVDAARTLLGATAEEQHDMGVAYARESGNCYVCNRTLTTPESMSRGIGPVCEGRTGGS